MRTTKINSADLLPVIDRIYDASLDASLWPATVASVAALYDTDKALLMTPGQLPCEGGIAFPAGIPEAAMQEWETRYAPQDVWVQVAVERGLFRQGAVVTDEDLYPHEELLAMVWYREFLSRIGIARLLSGVIFGAEKGAASPPRNNTHTALISIFRCAKAPPFAERERSLHGLLLPHLSRALGIQFQLRDVELKAASSLAALDRLAAGIVLFGGRGGVVFANRAAQAILQQEDGLAFRTLSGGRTGLTARDPRDQQALTAAITLCLNPATIQVDHFSHAIPIRRPSGRMAYTLNLSALPPHHEFGSGADRAHAILFIGDPEKPLQCDGAMLKRLYGLTVAECRLLPSLCSGEPLASIAAQLGLRESTVKTQLLSVFNKTGTHKRAQLVKLLLSLSVTVHYLTG